MPKFLREDAALDIRPVDSGKVSRVVPVLPDPEIQNLEGTGRLKVSGRWLQLMRCAYLLS